MFFWWPIGLSAQTNIYVSLRGNDAYSGTQIKPFATIHKAVEVARKTRGPVVVKLFGGTYNIMRPVVFTSADGRKTNESLTITNVESQKVIISGGAPLKNLMWKKMEKGIALMCSHLSKTGSNPAN